jgi:hypothetical protein
MDSIFWSLMVGGEGMGIFDHHPSIKNIALDEISGIQDYIKDNKQSEFFQGIVNSLKIPAYKQSSTIDFLKNIVFLEESMPYHKSFKDLWPEIHSLMIKQI